MNNHYDDGFLSLNGHSLNVYDVGRELAAWIDLLHPKPLKIGFQDRAILNRLIALVSNKRRSSLCVSIASPELAFATPMLRGIFGDGLDRAELISLTFEAQLKPSPICIELAEWQQFAVFESAEDVVAKGVESNADLKVFLLDAERDNLCRKLIDHVSEASRCFVIIRNYAKSGVTNHYGYARDRGLRVLENADGSGEFFAL
jgi:hypothetical protein